MYEIITRILEEDQEQRGTTSKLRKNTFERKQNTISFFHFSIVGDERIKKKQAKRARDNNEHVR